MRTLRALWRWTWRLGRAFALFVVAYSVVFWILGAIPVNVDRVAPSEGVPLWLESNGMHVRFMMPARHPVHDWTRELPPASFPYVETWRDHIAIGWGDRGFYLECPTLADLSLSIALRALSYTGSTAMHVAYVELPDDLPSQRRLLLTVDEYRQLVARVRASFARDTEDRPIRIPRRAYCDFDGFYEAVGSYGLTYTCNTWVNEHLRSIGLPTALYAVFAAGIMDHVQRR
jgi:uncharacterized protein (TIGR02117 family)